MSHPKKSAPSKNKSSINISAQISDAPPAHAAALPSGHEETAEVLYQKLGSRWYAFSLIDDELFVGSISDEEVNAQASGGSGVFKISGNS